MPGLQSQLVPGRSRHDRVGAQASPQLRDIHVHALERRRGRLRSPDVIDQSIGGNDLVRVYQQDAESGARLSLRQRHRALAAYDLQRPQDPEIKPALHPRSPACIVSRLLRGAKLPRHRGATRARPLPLLYRVQALLSRSPTATSEARLVGPYRAALGEKESRMNQRVNTIACALLRVRSSCPPPGRRPARAGQAPPDRRSRAIRSVESFRASFQHTNAAGVEGPTKASPQPELLQVVSGRPESRPPDVP